MGRFSGDFCGEPHGELYEQLDLQRIFIHLINLQPKMGQFNAEFVEKPHGDLCGQVEAKKTSLTRP